jgi:hypothetical protein
MLSEKDLPELQLARSLRVVAAYPRVPLTLYLGPAGDEGLDCRCELQR